MRVSMAGNPVQTRLVARDGLPVQQIPKASTSLAALPPQPRASRPSWNEFIEKTIALSAEQNQGSAVLSRLCKPELKTCVLAVAYLLKDGRQALATVFQGVDGSVTRQKCARVMSPTTQETA
jgi:hypothetical protein